MDNNLISNMLQIESTNLIRGGTGYSSNLFELKLQLHGEVSNPYTFNIKRNYNFYGDISSSIPTGSYFFTKCNKHFIVPDKILVIHASSQDYGLATGCISQNGKMWVDADNLSNYISVTPNKTYTFIDL